MPTCAKNKKAHHDYEILEEYEAGIVLTGQEVKAIKERKISIKGAYITIRGGEAYLLGAKIPPYQPKNISDDYNPERDRKLLLRKNQIQTLAGKVDRKGLTLVPLRVYTKGGLIKLKFGLAKGKKNRDKRKKIKERDAQRRIEKVMKSRGDE